MRNGAKREAVPSDPLSEPSYAPVPVGAPSADAPATGAAPVTGVESTSGVTPSTPTVPILPTSKTRANNKKTKAQAGMDLHN